MSNSFVRSITFTIPGTKGKPGTQVTVVEQDGNLVFTVDTLATTSKHGDLRGLFFNIDESVLGGLTVVNTSPIITSTRVGRNDVIDLGGGANMHGAVRGGFDVGVEFGTPGIGKDNVKGPVSFTLDSSTQDLTLDALTHMLFGVRMTGSGDKATFVAPAAPDARADSYNIFEDGQSGLNHPSTVPQGVRFEVLANDTDADGQKLTITDLKGVLHGTTQIVDGADPDLLPGDAILYTPFEDYSGTDSFSYLISDGHGGTDYAQVTVAIEAVADTPDLDVQILAGDAINESRLIVTATQTDADSSEYIDQILSSSLPGGVTLSLSSVNPGTEPDQIVQEFLLTLPVDTNADFDLTFTAVSKETSNGDEETASETINIVYEHNLNQFTPTFEAVDQSMWGPGDAFSFDDDRFLGVDRHDVGSVGSTFYASYDLDYKFGLQSTLQVGSGEVDASIPYAVDVETFYNHATDMLRFETDSAVNLSDSVFSTQSPLLTYTLDLIAALQASVTFGTSIDIPGVPGFLLFPGVCIDFGFEEVCTDDVYSPAIPGFSFSGSTTISPPGFDESLTLMEFDGDSLNLLGLEGDSALEYDLGEWVSIVAEIPHFETESEVVGDHLESSGSDNFLGLKVDVDQLITTLLGLPENPFGDEISFGAVTVGYDLLNYELTGSMGIGQDFSLEFGNVNGTLHFEDGYQYDFILGGDFDIANASSHDSNHDGELAFSLELTPDATFSSNLLLTLELAHALGVLGVHASIEVPVFDDPKFELGPVYEFEDVLADTSIDLVGLPGFALDLGSSTELFLV